MPKVPHPTPRESFLPTNLTHISISNGDASKTAPIASAAAAATTTAAGEAAGEGRGGVGVAGRMHRLDSANLRSLNSSLNSKAAPSFFNTHEALPPPFTLPPPEQQQQEEPGKNITIEAAAPLQAVEANAPHQAVVANATSSPILPNGYNLNGQVQGKGREVPDRHSEQNEDGRSLLRRRRALSDITGAPPLVLWLHDQRLQVRSQSPSPEEQPFTNIRVQGISVTYFQ